MHSKRAELNAMHSLYYVICTCAIKLIMTAYGRKMLITSEYL